jgi:4-amino-4-deoxy-L-arabinose transferase-like glycosyltransferase
MRGDAANRVTEAARASAEQGAVVRTLAARWPAWAAPIAATVAAFALRAEGASRYWINADEGIYYAVASAPSWSERWSAIAGNAHPPLHYLLLALIRALTDDAQWLRAPSVLFGALAAPAAYLLVRDLAGRGAGSLAAWLVALSPGAVMLSRTARPYGLQLFLLFACAACLLRAARGAGPRWLAGYALCAALAVLHHYSSFIALGALGASALAAFAIGAIPRERFARVALATLPALAAAASVGALHLAPALRSGFPEGAVAGWLAPYYAPSLGSLPSLWLGAIEYLSGPALAAPVFAAWVASVVFSLASRRWLVGGTALALFASASALSLVRLYPLGCTRHDLYLALAVVPVLAIALADALGRGALARRVAVVAALAALVAARDPLARALGRPPLPWRAHPELGLARTDVVEWLAPRLSEIARMPGVLWMDQFTSYTLMPLLARDPAQPAAPARALGFADEHALRVFRYGESDVVVGSAWFFSARASDRNAEHGLWRQLDRIRNERRDLTPKLAELRVVSANGPHLVDALRRHATERHRAGMPEPRSAQRRRGEVVSDVELRPPALALFRLDAVKLFAVGPWRSPSGADPDADP